VVCAVLLACACATLTSPNAELLSPLDQALSGDLPRLVSAAEAGDPEAQLAMAIIVGHGLHGRRADLLKAAMWRNQALAHRRVMPVTQYTAAFNGQPSRVNIIHVPVSGIPSGQITVLDRCLASLEAQGAAPTGMCGDTAERDAARRTAWANARR